MKYYLGVDGGGTKTEFVWVNEKDEVIHRELRGSSNPNDIGKDRMIADMVAAVSGNMPADCDNVDICMGLSGLGFAGCKDELISALKKIENVGCVDICSDVQIALDAAYDGDGCIVIMGTGSVGYIRKNGECILVGGCGYMIDSSLSGYDLGREALNAVCSEYDGRGEKTLLTELILKERVENISELVKNTYTQGKSYVASFAPYVFEAYIRGDKVAEKILIGRVREWEKLLLGVYKVYGSEHCEITLFGSLNRQWSILSLFLLPQIKEKISFRLPEYPTVFGALKRVKDGGNMVTNRKFLESYHEYL